MRLTLSTARRVYQLVVEPIEEEPEAPDDEGLVQGATSATLERAGADYDHEARGRIGFMRQEERS